MSSDFDKKSRLERIFTLVLEISKLELQLVCPHRRWYNSAYDVTSCLDCDINNRTQKEKLPEQISSLKKKLSSDYHIDYDWLAFDVNVSHQLNLKVKND